MKESTDFLISIVIPVGPEDGRWRELLADLNSVSEVHEVLLVAQKCPEDLPENAKWVEGDSRRASQLNRGAAQASGEYIWFLHSDTRVQASCFEALARSIEEAPEALHFFDLKFQKDGPSQMWLNTAGVWIRSRWMRMPFGDQGFCLSAALFQFLGGFDETVPFGEDHLLVWHAHQKHVPVRAVGAFISTSARKYKKGGWTQTTARTMYLTWKQALPELKKLLSERKWR